MPLFGPANVKRLKKKGDVGAIVALLDHENAKTATDAAVALGDLQDPTAARPLTSAWMIAGQVPMCGVSPSSGWSLLQAAGSALTSTTRAASAGPASTARSDSSER